MTPTIFLLEIMLVVLAGTLGASIASFLCVVQERTKKGEPITGTSHCACGRQLKWYENIPIIGWVRVKGVTPCCDQKIPPHYVVTETIMFTLFSATATILIIIAL